MLRNEQNISHDPVDRIEERIGHWHDRELNRCSTMLLSDTDPRDRGSKCVQRTGWKRENDIIATKIQTVF